MIKTGQKTSLDQEGSMLTQGLFSQRRSSFPWNGKSRNQELEKQKQMKATNSEMGKAMIRGVRHRQQSSLRGFCYQYDHQQIFEYFEGGFRGGYGRVCKNGWIRSIGLSDQELSQLYFLACLVGLDACLGHFLLLSPSFGHLISHQCEHQDYKTQPNPSHIYFMHRSKLPQFIKHQFSILGQYVQMLIHTTDIGYFLSYLDPFDLFLGTSQDYNIIVNNSHYSIEDPHASSRPSVIIKEGLTKLKVAGRKRPTNTTTGWSGYRLAHFDSGVLGQTSNLVFGAEAYSIIDGEIILTSAEKINGFSQIDFISLRKTTLVEIEKP